MLRLAHRILLQKRLPLYTFYLAETAEGCAPYEEQYAGIQALLKANTPTIIADNIAEYWNTHARTRTHPAWKELPPCPPPFPVVFIEWNWPAVVYDDGAVPLTSKQTNTTQAGALLVSEESSPETSDWLQCRFPARSVAQTKWTVHGVFVTTLLDGSVALTHRVGILLDDNGNWIDHTGDTYTSHEAGGASAAIVALTLGFMQCRNVARIDVTGTEGPTKKWCRRQRLPELKYHTLQIDPDINAKPHRNRRATEAYRSGKALHVCRGHFAHFIDDGVSAGLFGRHQLGTFWIPAHTRGSLEHGRVVSTYNVKAPSNS